MTTTSPVLDQPASPPDRPPPKRSRYGWVRPFLLRLHFYAGILIGPFILVAAISGTAYAVTPALEQVIYRQQLHVQPSATTLPLAEQIEAANRVADDPEALATVRPSPRPGTTTRVLYADESLGDDEHRAVFVDPGTGEIRGQEVVLGPEGALPLGLWVDKLHKNLHLGQVGYLYSELAASWLWIVALGGLALWIDRFRRRRRAAGSVVPERRVKGRRRLLGWHAPIGVWILVGLLGLSATGITWSELAGQNVTALRDNLGWQTPSVNTDLTGAAAEGGGEHAHHGGGAEPSGPPPSVTPAAFDRVEQLARSNGGIDGDPIEIARPTAEGEAWTVTERSMTLPIQADVAAVELGVDVGADRVVDRVDYERDFSIPAKLAKVGTLLHMGLLLGPVTQVALFVLGVAIIGLVLLGYRMWWRRRPTRGPAYARARVFGRPRPVGAELAPPGAVVLGIAAAGLIGYLLLPLFGISLAAFLLVDLVLAAIRRRTGAVPVR